LSDVQLIAVTMTPVRLRLGLQDAHGTGKQGAGQQARSGAARDHRDGPAAIRPLMLGAA
jgi:hypothetical protein